MFILNGIVRSRWAVLLGMLAVVGGCASTTQQTLSPNQIEPSTTKTNSVKPVSQIASTPPNKTFSYQLPLGIGGRFDMMMYETASNVSDFYDSYVKPMRNGKFLYNTMNYSILPSGGDLYRLDNELHDKTIKSDYDFRVGMTRRYSSITDFWKTDFWLAQDEYGPELQSVSIDRSGPFGLPPLFGNGHDGYLEGEYFNFDLNEIMQEEWNIDPDSAKTVGIILQTE